MWLNKRKLRSNHYHQGWTQQSSYTLRVRHVTPLDIDWTKKRYLPRVSVPHNQVMAIAIKTNKSVNTLANIAAQKPRVIAVI
jgi:hypothetical protein